MLLAAAAAALLLAGCGADPAPAAPDHNGTDVMYLQMMLAHHEPSADLLALGRTRATRPDVRAMATEFETARAAETTMMTGWLEEWGQPLAADADPARARRPRRRPARARRDRDRRAGGDGPRASSTSRSSTC